jgi:hypothetical protein
VPEPSCRREPTSTDIPTAGFSSHNFTKTYTFKAVSAAATLNASKAVTLKVAVK